MLWSFTAQKMRPANWIGCVLALALLVPFVAAIVDVNRNGIVDAPDYDAVTSLLSEMVAYRNMTVEECNASYSNSVCNALDTNDDGVIMYQETTNVKSFVSTVLNSGTDADCSSIKLEKRKWVCFNLSGDDGNFTSGEANASLQEIESVQDDLTVYILLSLSECEAQLDKETCEFLDSNNDGNIAYEELFPELRSIENQFTGTLSLRINETDVIINTNVNCQGTLYVTSNELNLNTNFQLQSGTYFVPYDISSKNYKIYNINATIVCQDGSKISSNYQIIDNDQDGYPSNYMIDCNDENPNVSPGSSEVCGNGIDDNCNGQADENCPAPTPSTGGGGGGGHAACRTNWVCFEWTSCKDGEQTRYCYDRNRCDEDNWKRIETRACTVEETSEQEQAQEQQEAQESSAQETIQPPAPTGAVVGGGQGNYYWLLGLGIVIVAIGAAAWALQRKK